MAQTTFCNGAGAEDPHQGQTHVGLSGSIPRCRCLERAHSRPKGVHSEREGSGNMGRRNSGHVLCGVEACSAGAHRQSGASATPRSRRQAAPADQRVYGGGASRQMPGAAAEPAPAQHQARGAPRPPHQSAGRALARARVEEQGAAA